MNNGGVTPGGLQHRLPLPLQPQAPKAPSTHPILKDVIARFVYSTLYGSFWLHRHAFAIAQ